MAETGGGAIQFTKLNGHKGSVLCLDITRDDSLLLSGSEDKTARLWDLRDSSQRQRASACIQTDGDVLSAAFAPPLSTCNVNEEPIAGEFAKNHSIYLSVDRFVYEYDLRQLKSPLVSRPTKDLSQILQNQDEVNQISVTTWRPIATGNKKKKGKKLNGASKTHAPESTYVATADDAGTVRFMSASLDGPDSSQILHHDPNGVAVVLSSAFRPNSKSLELASGGSDCKICLWDLSKPRRALSTYNILPSDESQEEEKSKPQVCNPPMVHCMSWSPSGRFLATGLGDGRCGIFAVENRSLVQIGSLYPGHHASVASVMFPCFGQGNERLLLSAGNDGAILCWDLGRSMDEICTNPAEIFPSALLQSNSSELNVAMDQISLGDTPRVMFGIPLSHKPNWMVGKRSPPTVFVCDTSSSITAYTIPIR